MLDQAESTQAKLLIVDDKAANLDLLREMLAPLGHQIFFATSGAKALEVATSALPDLVLLDVMMPEKDGYVVCQELKGDDKYCNIPIVLLTAVASHVTSTRYTHADGMATEADDYIAKPASAEEITKSIKRLLDL